MQKCDRSVDRTHTTSRFGIYCATITPCSQSVRGGGYESSELEIPDRGLGLAPATRLTATDARCRLVKQCLDLRYERQEVDADVEVDEQQGCLDKPETAMLYGVDSGVGQVDAIESVQPALYNAGADDILEDGMPRTWSLEARQEGRPV